LPYCKALKGLSLTFLLFFPILQGAGMDEIREEQLLKLSLHGFLNTECPEEQSDVVVPSLIRPVLLPGSVRSLSFKVKTSQPVTISVSLRQGEELEKMVSSVKAVESWQKIAMTPPPQASKGEGSVWESLRVELRDAGTPCPVQIKEPTFVLWSPKTLQSRTRLEWESELRLFVEGEELPVELLLLNLSKKEASHTFYAAIRPSWSPLIEPSPLTLVVEGHSLSRFDMRLPSPPLGIHEVTIREKVHEEEQMLMDQKVAVLPDPTLIASPGLKIDSDGPLPVWLQAFELSGDKEEGIPVGWSTPLSRSGVSEEEQAWRLARVYLESMGSKEGPFPVWSAWRDAQEGRGKGLITKQGEPKTSLSMLCNLSSTVREVLEHLPPDVEGMEGFRFSGPPGFGWALWTAGEEQTIALQAESGSAWTMRDDGTLRNLFPAEMEPQLAWTLLPVGERPTILLDASSQTTSWSQLISFRGQKERVKGGESFRVRYRFEIPQGLRLRGTLRPSFPPGWRAAPERTELDLVGPSREVFAVRWRAPWPGKPGEQRLELGLCLASKDSSTVLCSHRVILLPTVESRVRGVPEDESVLFSAQVRPLVGRPFSGKLTFQIGEAEPLVREFPKVGVGSKVEMRARMVWSNSMPSILDFPCSLNLETEKGSERILSRVIVGRVKPGSAYIDGNWEEWQGTPAVELGRPGDLRLFRLDAEPRAAKACLLWNETGLAIGARIEDSMAAEGDGLEIAIQGREAETAFFRLPLEGSPGMRTEKEGGLLFACGHGGGEIFYEALVPWSALDLDPMTKESDRRMSLSLGVCDAEESGVAYMTGWGLFGWKEGERPEPQVELLLVPSEASLEE